jgi:hypothetical protein
MHRQAGARLGGLLSPVGIVIACRSYWLESGTAQGDFGVLESPGSSALLGSLLKEELTPVVDSIRQIDAKVTSAWR